MALVIGIDTGGTFTDAVLFDTSAARILAKAKALTTRGDLAIGVAEAMRRALAGAGPADGRAAVAGAGAVGLVSVSTTLATNAIVEGQGGPIAVLTAGFDAGMIARTGIAAALPGTPLAAIPGGHDHAGEELAPLDLAAAEAFFLRHGAEVDAFAVAAQYSIRNPDHERRLGELATRLTGRPASLSSDLATGLDAPRRALTAALNARLVGRITALVAAIRRAMADLGVQAPLMLVKGDGTLAAADTVARRPVETILSGPAASVIGARVQSGLADFVLADIGGTTTDVAVLEDGWPRLDREGAEVGGFRTLVRAVEMRTYGLGGDSEVDLAADGTILVGPRRVVPVSLAAARRPALTARLQASLGADEAGGHPARFAIRPFGASAPVDGQGLSDRERGLLARIGDEPVPLGDLLADPRQRRAFDRLVAAGRVQVIGFTPSDAHHVTRRQATWDGAAAEAAARLLVRHRRMGRADAAAAADFARAVEDRVAALSARAVLETVTRRPPGVADDLFDAVAAGRKTWRGLAVTLSPPVPVVAVGGPAGLVYPEAARRLGAELRLLPDGDVANALGAAAGPVRGRAVVEVTARGGGGWRVHHAGGVADLAEAGPALAEAAARAEAEALAAAQAMGASAPVVRLRTDRIDLPGVTGDAALVSALVTAEATGDPVPA